MITSCGFITNGLVSLRQILGKKEVISRDKKAIGKELDIYIPSKKYAIEYGAWYWHKKRIKNDQSKIKECEYKNIKLLCIYDACPENICLKNTITFKEELAQNLNVVKQILSDVFGELDINYSFSEEQWNKIREKAYIKSRKMTTEEFKKKLKKINKNVEVLEEYKGSHIQTKVRCLKCGNEWNAIPKELLKGAGCLKCYRMKQFDSQETFKKKVAKINPNVEIIGTYSKQKDRIKTKCKICGHIWNPWANNLMQGKK